MIASLYLCSVFVPQEKYGKCPFK